VGLGRSRREFTALLHVRSDFFFTEHNEYLASNVDIRLLGRYEQY
jgi:hypothetical protein